LILLLDSIKPFAYGSSGSGGFEWALCSVGRAMISKTANEQLIKSFESTGTLD